jgi:hypothetical protein
MFELKEQEALLISKNDRAENHGQEKVPTIDLKVSMKLSNRFLDNFDPALKGFLFAKDEDEPQADMDDSNPDHLTKLRFPMLGTSQGLKYKGAGYRVTFHSLLGKSDINLIQCGIDKVKFEPQEGGGIILSFMISAHANAAEAGALYEAIQRPITITVTPPSPEEQAQMELNQAAA